MDSELKREIIVDNYQNPTNKCDICDDGFIKASSKSDSCIDSIDLYVKFDGDKISDIYFNGEACAITTSATSIMIRMFIGKSIDECMNIIDNYTNMLEEKDYDRELLGELLVYDDIYKQPNRKKCAYFPFDTFIKAINKYKDNN